LSPVTIQSAMQLSQAITLAIRASIKFLDVLTFVDIILLINFSNTTKML